MKFVYKLVSLSSVFTLILGSVSWAGGHFVNPPDGCPAELSKLFSAALVRADLVEYPFWSLAEEQSGQTVVFSQLVDIDDPRGSRALLRRTGSTWAGTFASRPRQDLQSDPRSLMIGLGNLEASRFWGFEMVDAAHMFAPGPDRLNYALSRVNAQLPADKQIPLQFIWGSHLPGDNPEIQLRTAASAADRLTIYIADKGNMLVHDIAVHTPIFLPPYILEILYQRARFVVELVDFFRDILKEEIQFNLTASTKVFHPEQKFIEAILQSLMVAEASAHDEITGNSLINLRAHLVLLGKGESVNTGNLDHLFEQGFSRPTLEGQGFERYFGHIKNFFQGGKLTSVSALRPYMNAFQGVREPFDAGDDNKAWLKKVFDLFVDQKPWVRSLVAKGALVDRPKTSNNFLGEIFQRRREILEATLLAQILESQNPPRPSAPVGQVQTP